MNPTTIMKDSSSKAFASMSVGDILPVSKSWNGLRSRPGAVNDFAMTVFLKLLMLEPKAREAFGKDENGNAVDSHVRAMGEALDQFFSSLFKVEEELLLDLGRRHAKYPGFHVGYLSSFSLAITHGLREHLGALWNLRLAMRWERVIVNMMGIVGVGAEAATPLSQPVNVHETLEIQDVQPVLESWGLVQQKANYCEVFGELVFRKLFELAPGAPGLFPFGRLKGEALFASRMFKRHSIKVFSTFDMVVSSLLDLDKGPLIQLGARHASFGGVEVPHFATLGLAILSVLEQLIGTSWNDDLKGHWINVISFLSCSMIEGMASARFL